MWFWLSLFCLALMIVVMFTPVFWVYLNKKSKGRGEIFTAIFVGLALAGYAYCNYQYQTEEGMVLKWSYSNCRYIWVDKNTREVR